MNVSAANIVAFIHHAILPAVLAQVRFTIVFNLSPERLGTKIAFKPFFPATLNNFHYTGSLATITITIYISAHFSD